jgi:mRNA interferase MazF
VSRGEIWWAQLPKPRGSEPGYSRPVVVVSTDRFNSSNIRTVLCVAITSNVQLAAASGNVMLSPTDSGLAKPSVANVSQLLTIDKSFLFKRVGRLSSAVFQQVEDGLRLVLGL